MQIKLNHPYALNEQGRRDHPEDSIYPPKGAANPNNRFFIVCDGVGGYSRGEVASQTVCAAFASFLKDGGEKFNKALFEKALEYAYAELDSVDVEDSGPKMGTTLAFAYFHSRGVTLAHIGDSRIYQLRKQGGPVGILYRSRDHTHVNELVRAKIITEEEVAAHPKRSTLTRVMQPGQPKLVKAEYNEITDVAAGDYFFLCTDGILESVGDETLCNIIGSGCSDESKMKAIHEACLENSQDNFSAYLISVDGVIHGEMDIETPSPMPGTGGAEPGNEGKKGPSRNNQLLHDADKKAARQPAATAKAGNRAVLFAFLPGIAAVLALFYGWKYMEVIKGALVNLRVSFGPQRPSGNASPTVTTGGASSNLVSVPDVAGLARTDAETKIRSAGLEVGDVTDANHKTVPSGHVIEQSVKPGDKVKAGKSIGITLSSGPAPTQAPATDTGDNTQGAPPPARLSYFNQFLKSRG